MAILDRYLRPAIEAALASKMAFIGGPRQLGKTTLALSLLEPASSKHPAYLNWDDPRVAPRLRAGELLGFLKQRWHHALLLGGA